MTNASEIILRLRDTASFSAGVLVGTVKRFSQSVDEGKLPGREYFDELMEVSARAEVYRSITDIFERFENDTDDRLVHEIFAEGNKQIQALTWGGVKTQKVYEDFIFETWRHVFSVLSTYDGE